MPAINRVDPTRATPIPAQFSRHLTAISKCPRARDWVGEMAQHGVHKVCRSKTGFRQPLGSLLVTVPTCPKLHSPGRRVSNRDVFPPLPAERARRWAGPTSSDGIVTQEVVQCVVAGESSEGMPNRSADWLFRVHSSLLSY
jgi:hypothetical protein